MPAKNPPHPGEVIRELCIDPLELTITEAADALDVTRPTLSKLVNGKASISPEMAVKLAKTFGSTPAFWLRMQMQYDLVQLEKHAPQIHVNHIFSSPHASPPADCS